LKKKDCNRNHFDEYLVKFKVYNRGLGESDKVSISHQTLKNVIVCVPSALVASDPTDPTAVRTGAATAVAANSDGSAVSGGPLASSSWAKWGRLALGSSILKSKDHICKLNPSGLLKILIHFQSSSYGWAIMCREYDLYLRKKGDYSGGNEC
jgi:hypothetical protein